MRKLIAGLTVCISVILGFANAAAAESEEPMPEASEKEQVSPVECTFHNFTYPTVPEHWAYMVGDAIDFEITLSDPDNTVANIVFSAGTDNKGGKIQEGLNRQVTWTAPAPGQWTITSQLFDVNGQEIIPTGDCDGAVTVLTMTDPVDPDHPDEWIPEEPKPVDDTCADDDPSTLVPVNNPDGSTSWYSPGGAFCGTILPPTQAPQTPETPSVQPVVAETDHLSELPRTGTGLVITSIIGFLLLLCGSFMMFVRRYLPYARPMKR